MVSNTDKRKRVRMGNRTGEPFGLPMPHVQYKHNCFDLCHFFAALIGPSYRSTVPSCRWVIVLFSKLLRKRLSAASAFTILRLGC